MKIGIFGGTFNPPHNTHVEIARAALSQLRLDKLFVLPCGDPPHKKCDVDKETRLKLCHLAFDGIAEVDDYEIRKAGKSYTVETLEHFAQLYPQAELFLVIGGDSLADFGKWHCPKQIAELCTLTVADRDSSDVANASNEARRKFDANVVLLQFTPTALSSTEIRLRYEFGMDNGEYMPEAVDSYILQNGLYGEHRAMALAVKDYLTPQRFLHTFYVVKRGQELAPEHLKEKAFVACLLHDVAKYISKSDYRKYRFTQGDLPDSVVHSFLGSYVAQLDFGIDDAEILDAIEFHTTGRPNMSELEKIVYIADKTEDTRPYDTAHLKCGTLDDQFVACLKEAYSVCLEQHNDSVCPLSEMTVRWYCPKDFGMPPFTVEEIQQYKSEKVKTRRRGK